MAKTLLPIGIRRDGSYYTRIEWASHTESNPLLWVCNVINDDVERNGGTWGANTNGPANLVLSFFGEDQTIGKIKIFHNVGMTISILEELAKQINVYVSSNDEVRNLRGDEDNIESVSWELIAQLKMKKEECWQEFTIKNPVKAKYIRVELVENFGTPPHIPWTETSEIKIYP